MEEEKNLDTIQPEETQPRPLWQRVAAWVMIVIVLGGFLGWCYWMATAGAL